MEIHFHIHPATWDRTATYISDHISESCNRTAALMMPTVVGEEREGEGEERRGEESRTSTVHIEGDACIASCSRLGVGHVDILLVECHELCGRRRSGYVHSPTPLSEIADGIISAG